MPHQIKGIITISTGPKTILSRPKIAALIGCIAAESSFLDRQIMGLYAYLMGTILPRKEGFGPPVHPVAFQVFDSLHTSRQRISLLRKLSKSVIKDKSLLKELNDEVISSIEDSAKLRNPIIHSTWGIAAEYPCALIQISIFGRDLVFEESEFHEALNGIVSAGHIVRKFKEKAMKFIEIEGT